MTELCLGYYYVGCVCCVCCGQVMVQLPMCGCEYIMGRFLSVCVPVTCIMWDVYVVGRLSVCVWGCV